MKIDVSSRGEVNVVYIEGAIHPGDEHSLAEKVENYIKPKEAPKFIIDLEHVSFMNSSALGMFVSIFNHVEKLNGRMVLTAINSDIENLLSITRLSNVFEIFRNVDEAFESFDF